VSVERLSFDGFPNLTRCGLRAPGVLIVPPGIAC
jgi:hypothetical protein